jgi:hypothetical protein
MYNNFHFAEERRPFSTAFVISSQNKWRRIRRRGQGHRRSSITPQIEVSGRISTCTRAVELIPCTAKKLKKAWVDAKKIKKVWRAEKRRQGIQMQQMGVEEEGEGQDVEDDVEAGEEEEEWKGIEGAMHENSRAEQQQERRGVPAHQPSRLAEKAVPEQAPSAPSLRDMAREAYSRSTLHQYKSHPLQQKRGRSTRWAERGSGGREDEESGRGRGRRRGQPNMKLRMDVMLEQIKRSLS